MRWNLNVNSWSFLRISNGYTSQNGPKSSSQENRTKGNFPVSHKTWPNEGGSSDRPFGGAKNNYPVSHYGEPGMMYFRILNEELFRTPESSKSQGVIRNRVPYSFGWLMFNKEGSTKICQKEILKFNDWMTQKIPSAKSPGSLLQVFTTVIYIPKRWRSQNCQVLYGRWSSHL